MRYGGIAALFVAIAVAFRGHLALRLARNLFTPGVPRGVEPRYPLVEESVLAAEITVVVGTKDSVTPSVTQLAHLATALPANVRVVYTYPRPLFEDTAAYAAKLRAAAGPLAKRLKLLPVDTFANPFQAWLQAAPLVKTKYTLLMHNDVFLLDDRGHFLSELHGALERHPDIAVAAPQIYETEFKGLLTTHLFNTNLHLRKDRESGVAFMSHEVDLVTGTSREPGDFAQRTNRNFLEDHVFLIRSAHVDAEFIDPDAAFTLEYVDLQLNMLRKNLTQLYVPSARAEFRLWEFGWQDVPYFVRRRSEEQARKTKQHLERKWGVQFPNTGFCNFVKFSVIRHVELEWTNLPSRWVEQAGLVVSWFEMAGFNRHGDAALAELGEEHTLGELLVRLQRAPHHASAGLAIASRRELVPTAEVQAADWVETGIGEILHFQETPRRMETRYQVEHMSLAVLRVPLGPDFPFERERVRPLCGLLLRTKAHDECWIYVAPHRYDHPLVQAIEWALHRMRVGPRVALGMAMKLTNAELTPGRYDGQLRKLGAAGVRVTMCGEHHWRCSARYEFPPDGRLLHWSGRMNSWPLVLRTLLPHAEELGALYAAMALLVSIGAAATASSATAAKSAAAVVLLDYGLVLLGVQAAHAPVLAWASRTALVRPVWRRAVLCAWLASLCAVNTALISRYEALAFATLVVALCAMRRLRLALLTLQANHKPSLALPALSRLIGSLNSSPAHAHALHAAAVPAGAPAGGAAGGFYALDGAPPALVARRVAAMAALRARWAVRWPRATELCAALCGAHREAMPVDCPPAAAAAAEEEGEEDGASPAARKGGAGGKAGNKGAAQQARPAGAAAGGEPAKPPPHPAAPPLDAAGVGALHDASTARLQRLAGKEAVHFHLSGSEALVAAARLARANTGKPLLVVFGGGAHGWADGVAAEGLSLGEERYACDVLTLREQCLATLAVLHLRREEIAAVVVNPLRGLMADTAPPPAAAAPDAPTWSAGWLPRLAWRWQRWYEQLYAWPWWVGGDWSGSELRAHLGAGGGGAGGGGAGGGGAGGGGAGGATGGGATAYGCWLLELRAACTRAGIALVFDEGCTGFRLAPGGAQQYFGVAADIVCYGKALGGGLPIGAVCGSAAMLASSEPHLPLRPGVEGGASGVADHPALMASTHAFLSRLDAPALAGAHAALHARVGAWVLETNAELARAALPLRVASAASVWGFHFGAPSRYNWLLLPLLRDEGVQLQWLAPGRLGFALETSADELAELRRAIARAAGRMRADGWWPAPGAVAPLSDARLKRQLAGEVLVAIASRLELLLAELLPAPKARATVKAAWRRVVGVSCEP